MLGDQVVVAVVVQDTRASLVRAGSDQYIGRSETVVADGCELSLRPQSAAFHPAVDCDVRQSAESVHDLQVVARRASGEASLEHATKPSCQAVARYLP